MTKSALLKVVLGEFQEGETQWRLLYQDIVQLLWREGFSGLTACRADEGLDEENRLRSLVLENISFNNLPIVIETFENQDKIQAVLPKLKNKGFHGRIVIMPAYSLFEEEDSMQDHDFLMLKIYVKEKSNWLGRTLYEELLEFLQKHDLRWSVLSRGIEGFGRDHVIHKSSLFSLSSQVPVLIESVGKTDVIKKLIPELKKRIKDGLVITIPVDVELDS
ncbi:DUF190 domain-containing protein [Aneurinibacillus terranovensis]|uniref:DUF190 domain-containing protein n=1 Tax=Aneurinibacillus terranovensis TaxID=278991 RepID=UPI00040D37CC|nr:DUF190 domain-containing protein [Aneurinibacillus terranovensis]